MLLKDFRFDSLRNLENLIIIDLSSNQIKYWNNSYLGLKSVQTLKLNNNLLDYSYETSLKHFEKLNYIDLSSNKFKNLNKNIFEDTINLIEIDLSNNEIADLNKKFFIDLSHLQILKLNNNKIRNLDKNLFLDLNNLTVLDLSNNKLENIRDFNVKNLDKLNHLNLTGNLFETNSLNNVVMFIETQCGLNLNDLIIDLKLENVPNVYVQCRGTCKNDLIRNLKGMFNV